MADSSILKDGKPFFIPDFAKDFRFNTSIVVRISRLGKNISAKFAPRYYDAITVGLLVKAVDIEAKYNEVEQNCAIAQAFDGAAILGRLIPIEEIGDINNISYSAHINNEKVHSENTKNMCLNIDRLIEYLSHYFTMKIGDYIFTGYSADAIKLENCNIISAKINGYEVMNFRIK